MCHQLAPDGGKIDGKVLAPVGTKGRARFADPRDKAGAVLTFLVRQTRVMAEHRVGQRLGNGHGPGWCLFEKNPSARRRVIDPRVLAAQHVIEVGIVFPQIVKPPRNASCISQPKRGAALPCQAFDLGQMVGQQLPI